jgi:FKBP-type peptidyl-prolyl cis-trans isomerase FkpA
MKKTIFPLLIIFVIGLITTIGLPSCRKDKFQPTIKQYDSIQIANYIAANGLTGFQKDLIGGDTSGIYYKIISPGSGTPLQYSDSIKFVFNERSFDGLYIQADTISNHFADYVGHIQAVGFPLGLQIAVHDLLVYPNATMRVLIPSHLAFGVDGKGSGSNQVANNKIAGNQCLDFTIHAINNFPPYDDLVIRNYMRDSSLTGYTKTADGLYYKILTSATTDDPITANSSITATYTGQLLDGTIFDGSHNGTNILPGTTIFTFILGVQEGLINYAVAGTKISLLIPSSLAYGLTPQTSVPPFSCLRFTWQIISVAP